MKNTPAKQLVQRRYKAKAGQSAAEAAFGGIFLAVLLYLSVAAILGFRDYQIFQASTRESARAVSEQIGQDTETTEAIGKAAYIQEMQSNNINISDNDLRGTFTITALAPDGTATFEPGGSVTVATTYTWTDPVFGVSLPWHAKSTWQIQTHASE